MENRKDFKAWYDDFCIAFPATAIFVNENAKGDEDRRQAILLKWHEALAGCSLEDALEATRRMLDGRFEPVAATDRSLTPSHVAGLCERLRGERFRPVPEPDDGLRPGEKPAEFDSLAIMREMIRAREQGGQAAVDDVKRRLMPVDREHQPRYRCLDCQDRGLVFVWHPHSMRLAKNRELVLGGKGFYQQGIRCPCAAGNRYEGLSRGYNRHTNSYEFDKPLMYDPERWRKCHGFNQLDIEDLQLFMDNLKPAGYEASFDEFNSDTATY